MDIGMRAGATEGRYNRSILEDVPEFYGSRVQTNTRVTSSFGMNMNFCVDVFEGAEKEKDVAKIKDWGMHGHGFCGYRDD